MYIIRKHRLFDLIFFYIIIPIVIIFSINLFNNLIFFIAILSSFLFYKKEKISIEKKDKFFFLFNFLVIIFLFLFFFIEEKFVNLKILVLFKFFFTYFSFKYCFKNFFKKKKNYFKSSIFITLALITMSMIIELFFNFNLGTWSHASIQDSKISGFYGEEKIAGTIIFYIYFIYFILFQMGKKLNILSILILSFFFLFIFFSGQRSILIKFLFFQIIFFYFVFFKKWKIRLIVFAFLTLIVLFFAYANNKSIIYFIKNNINNAQQNSQIKEKPCHIYPYQIGRIICRQTESIYFQISNFRNESYIFLYLTSFEIFKDNKILGIGIKNFRNKCANIDLKNYKFLKKENYHMQCNAHPHNSILEILTELGIFGFGFIVFCIIFVLKQIKEYNFLIFSMIITAYLFPFVPSGSFFNNTNFTFFLLTLCCYLLKQNEKNS